MRNPRMMTLDTAVLVLNQAETFNETRMYRSVARRPRRSARRMPDRWHRWRVFVGIDFE